MFSINFVTILLLTLNIKALTQLIIKQLKYTLSLCEL